LRDVVALVLPDVPDVLLFACGVGVDEVFGLDMLSVPVLVEPAVDPEADPLGVELVDPEPVAAAPLSPCGELAFCWLHAMAKANSANNARTSESFRICFLQRPSAGEMN
jgi:hypothetical protein